METHERLLQIGNAIKSGQDPNSFQAELDQLLGTSMEDRDAVAEATWEADYRREDFE